MSNLKSNPKLKDGVTGKEAKVDSFKCPSPSCHKKDPEILIRQTSKDMPPGLAFYQYACGSCGVIISIQIGPEINRETSLIEKPTGGRFN